MALPTAVPSQSVRRAIRAARALVRLAIALAALTLATPAAAEPMFADLPSWVAPVQDTYGVALGDVDGDGRLDVVRANIGQEATLHLNVGGTFATVPAWRGPIEQTRAVALGDIDGDGDLDLVRGNAGQGATLYLNHGGTFDATPAWTGQSEQTRAVALGDVDGDGDLDLVLGNLSQGSTLYLNAGGTFTAAPVWTGPAAATYAVALGDVDGDGRVDLVLGNLDAPSLLFLNIGGTFASTPAWTGPTEATRAVALGDVNGDGRLDLVRGNLGAGATLTLNTGTTFAAVPVWTSPAESTWAVAVGDVDSDGRLDLVRGNSERGSSLYLNVGGTFGATPAWVGPVEETRSLALGDVDGDGDLDLVRGNFGQASTLYLNVSGPLAPAAAWTGPKGDTHAMALGDVDGDGDLDLVRASPDGPTTLTLNDAGVLRNAVAWPGPPEPTLAVALGDVDGDGDLDLVRGNFAQGTTLYLNVGGVFAATPVWTSPPNAPQNTVSVALGDVDGDGALDLVCGNLDQRATVYRNIGGTFAASPTWTGPVESTNAIALGDVDGDGRLDLVRGNLDTGTTLYLGAGVAFADTAAWTGPLERTASVALGDVNGDGRLDLVRGNRDQGATLYLGAPGGFAHSPAWTGPVERTVSVALGDLDGDGDLDLVRGNIDPVASVYVNDGGTFTATPVATVAVDSSWCVTLGDVDGDGALDAMLGHRELHLNRTPWIVNNVAASALPNDAAHLRWVRAAPIAPNHYRVSVQAVDAESDPLWIRGEYQFAGSPSWSPMRLAGGSATAGPFDASPAGIAHDLDWDVTTVPFDRRTVNVRLQALSSPRRAGAVAFVPAHVAGVGRVTPHRPSLDVLPASIAFPTVTVGDTVVDSIVVANPGNVDLVVQSITSANPDIEVLGGSGLTVSAGARQALPVRFAPRAATPGVGSIHIVADDPARPTADIGFTSDVRALTYTTQLLAVAPELPLGEAATVVVTPGAGVRIETGWLCYRAHGAAAFADSAQLVPQGANFIALVPSGAVTEAGLDYYVRAENSGVTRTDPPAAPVTFFTQPVAAPDRVVAHADADARGAFPAGRAALIVAALQTGAQFDSGAVFYRRGGAAAYDSLPLVPIEVSPGTIEPAASIPADAVGPRGLDFWVRVSTRTRTLTDPPATPAASPKSIRVTVDRLTEPASHEPRRYRLMSVPLDLDLPAPASLEALLSDQPEFGPPDVARWRAYRYVPALGNYLEVGGGGDTRLHPEPGRAFWLVCASSNQIDTAPVPGRSTPTDAPYVVTLDSGWNQLGDPFVFPVAWSDVTATGPSGAVTLEPPVGWNEATGQYLDGDIIVLSPFSGCWVWNPTPDPVALHIPPIEATSLNAHTAAMSAAAGDSLEWTMRLVARCDDAEDRRNFAGVARAAREGADALDRAEPPASPGRGVALYFLDPTVADGPRRSIDLQSPLPATDEASSRGRTWVFDVARPGDDRAAADTRLDFEDLARVPQDLEVRLIDRALDRVIDPRREPGYAFVSTHRAPVTSAAGARFELRIGTAEFVAASVTAGTAVTRLLPCVPNPVRTDATVRFDLARTGPVTLELFDIAGRRVTTLARGPHAAGRHELAWTPRDGAGHALAPGVYALRLVADGRSDVRRLVVSR